jgi:hypothetical protein
LSDDVEKYFFFTFQVTFLEIGAKHSVLPFRNMTAFVENKTLFVTMYAFQMPHPSI